jgi:hypothetical protein
MQYTEASERSPMDDGDDDDGGDYYYYYYYYYYSDFPLTTVVFSSIALWPITASLKHLLLAYNMWLYVCTEWLNARRVKRSTLQGKYNSLRVMQRG